MSLAIPIRALEPHLDGLVEVLSGGSGRLPVRPEKTSGSAFTHHFGRGNGGLGSTSITLGELQSMAVGDVRIWIKSSHHSPWAVERPGRCTWAIGEIAESFALVRPHKHQISLIFGRMVPSPQMVWGRFASGGSPPCANGVLTFDPSAMPLSHAGTVVVLWPPCGRARFE